VQAEEPLSRRDTAVAALPYFLFALFLGGSTLYYRFGQTTNPTISFLLGYGFLFVLLFMLIIAWWRGWPAWSVCWLGFLSFVLIVLFLPGQLFDQLHSADPQTQLLQTIMTEVDFALLWLLVLYALLVRWPRSGLVAMLPAFGMAWVLYLEFVPEIVNTAVLVVTWVWLGIVAIILLRWRHQAWDVWLLYLAAIIVGAIYIYTGHFLTEMQVRDGTLTRMGEDLLSSLLPALIPLVGILLLHALRFLSQVNGRTAVGSYRRILAGVLLTVIGLQSNLQLLRQGNLPAMQRGMGVWFTAVLLIGLLLMLTGAGLMVKSQRQWLLSPGWTIWLMLGLLLLLPLIFNTRRLLITYNQMMYQWVGPDLFAQKYEALVLLLMPVSYLLGIVWLMLAGWVIGRTRATSAEIKKSLTPQE
jgi:hypothetical protein